MFSFNRSGSLQPDFVARQRGNHMKCFGIHSMKVSGLGVAGALALAGAGCNSESVTIDPSGSGDSDPSLEYQFPDFPTGSTPTSPTAPNNTVCNPFGAGLKTGVGQGVWAQ